MASMVKPWHIIVFVVVLVLLFGAKRLPDAAHALDLMTGIYEQAAREAATHRHRPGGFGAEPPAGKAKGISRRRT